MTVREMIAEIEKHGQVKINGWTVKKDRGVYAAHNEKGYIRCVGNEAKVHNFVRNNSPS